MAEADWLHSPRNPGRLCITPGCGKVGHSRGRKKRHRLCYQCRLKASPYYATSQRRKTRRAISDSRLLLRGEAVMCQSDHHRAVRYLLDGKSGDSLTVSRTCPPECPDSYIGYDYRRGEKVDYPLCLNPDHYALETLAENLARGPHSGQI